MVHQRKRRIHSGHGFAGSFDTPDRSWVIDPDPDHPKERTLGALKRPDKARSEGKRDRRI